MTDHKKLLATLNSEGRLIQHSLDKWHDELRELMVSKYGEEKIARYEDSLKVEL